MNIEKIKAKINEGKKEKEIFLNRHKNLFFKIEKIQVSIVDGFFHFSIPNYLISIKEVDTVGEIIEENGKYFFVGFIKKTSIPSFLKNLENFQECQ